MKHLKNEHLWQSFGNVLYTLPVLGLARRSYPFFQLACTSPEKLTHASVILPCVIWQWICPANLDITTPPPPLPWFGPLMTETSTSCPWDWWHAENTSDILSLSLSHSPSSSPIHFLIFTKKNKTKNQHSGLVKRNKQLIPLFFLHISV